MVSKRKREESGAAEHSDAAQVQNKEPSLKRLKALDSIEAFKDRLREAANIINVKLDIINDHVETGSKPARGQSRVEFILRWLLQKLSADDDAGSEARATADAWVLLGKTFNRLPAAKVARQLSTFRFLDVVEKALLESFPPMEAAPSHEEHSKVNGHKSVMKPSKRGKHTEVKELGSLHPEALLFVSIASSLRALLHETARLSHGQESVATEQLKSVLRTDTKQAARLVKVWFVGLYRAFCQDTEEWRRTDASQSDWGWLADPIKSIWNSRSVSGADDAWSTATRLANEALLPMTLVLSHTDSIFLREMAGGHELGYFVAHKQQPWKTCIEQLIARNIWLPAKALTDDGDTAVANIASLLQPLSSYHEKETEASKAGPSLCIGIACILDVAMCCVPHTGPKSRLERNAWASTLYAAVESALGTRELRRTVFSDGPVTPNLLEYVLDVFLDHGIVLNSKVVRSLIKEHCALATDNPSWGILGRVIALDDTVLIDLQSEEVGRVFSALTHHSVNASRGDTGLFWPARRSSQKLSEANSTMESRIFGSGPYTVPVIDVMVQRVIRPLVSQFSRTRQLDAVVSRWLSEMEDPDQELDHDLIWFEPRVSQIISAEIPLALTEGQIISYLTQFKERLTAFKEDLDIIKDSIPVSERSETGRSIKRARAAVVVLCSLLEGLHPTAISTMSEAVRGKVEELLDALPSVLTHPCFSLDRDLSAVRRLRSIVRHGLFWKALRLSLEIVATASNAEIRKALCEKLLKSGCFDVLLKELHMQQAAQDPGERSADYAIQGEVLRFVMTSLNYIHAMQGTGDFVGKLMETAAKAAVTPRGTSGEHLDVITAAELVRYPELLGYLTHSTRASILQRMVTDIGTGGSVPSVKPHDCPNADSKLKLHKASKTGALGEERREISMRLVIEAIYDYATTASRKEVREDVFTAFKPLLDHLRKSRIEFPLKQTMNSKQRIELDNAAAINTMSLVELCSQLESPPDIRAFQISFKALERMLRKNQTSVSQHDIDTLMATITIACTSSGPALGPQYASRIYMDLCVLAHILVTTYRYRVRGRFHLLMLVLQRLLNCLFIPTSTRMFSDFPPWIAYRPSNEHSKLTKLKPNHATAFARVLTGLCDPPVSAVPRSKKSSSALVDDSKKEKRYVGQHIAPLLQEYCWCQLNGRLDPELKDQLMPGIYAAMNTMDIEGMRGLSAAMDTPGRAIWKSLYTDWSSFGRR